MKSAIKNSSSNIYISIRYISPKMKFIVTAVFLHTKISALFVERIFLPVYLFFSFNAASMKPWKRGCGLFGRLLNSGCACVASK